jgi:hypothetical protein
MLRRLSVCLLLLLSLVPAFGAGTAFAHGPVRRGFELDFSGTLKIPTGSATNQARWLTVGLRRGHFSAVIRLNSCSKSNLPSCGVYMSLAQPGRTLHVVTAGCSMKHPRCGATARIDQNVTSPGVYYISIVGLGSGTIMSSLTVKGNIYPLHCHKYC